MIPVLQKTKLSYYNIGEIPNGSRVREQWNQDNKPNKQKNNKKNDDSKYVSSK